MLHAKTLLAAAALSTLAFGAHAGGMGDAIEDAGPIVVPVQPPAGSSLNSGYVVLGLLAALVAASGSF